MCQSNAYDNAEILIPIHIILFFLNMQTVTIGICLILFFILIVCFFAYRNQDSLPKNETTWPVASSNEADQLKVYWQLPKHWSII